MQRPKSEGLGAAFGGGVTENIFGAQTTNVLVKFTGWLAGIFFVLTFVLGVLYAQRSSSESALHKELMGMQTPAAAMTASPAPAAASPAATTAPSAAANPAANVSPAATVSVAPQSTPPGPSPSASP
jgi:preprotein translocase subunit SecG